VADEVQPVIVYAKVRQVTKEENRLLTPLVPIRPDTSHFILTICYDLMKHGVSCEVREKYRLTSITKTDVINFITRSGRCIESEESFKSKVWGFWKTEVTREGIEEEIVGRL